MKPPLDEAGVERAALGVALALPRTPHRGKVGEVRASSVGSSMEIHDFRTYQPGDDLRHIDWNAVARTGELTLRVRQDEVSPRVEVVLDASASMAVSPQKAARARELALLFCKVASRQGLEPTLLATSGTPMRAVGSACVATIRAAPFDARDHLSAGLRRGPPLRPCGLRLVVSDFLFEAPLEVLVERLSAGAAALALIQVLDGQDVEPDLGEGARLVDAESAEFVERVLSSQVVDHYLRRLDEHQRLLRSAAGRVKGLLLTASAEVDVERLARTVLAPVLGGAR